MAANALHPKGHVDYLCHLQPQSIYPSKVSWANLELAVSNPTIHIDNIYRRGNWQAINMCTPLGLLDYLNCELLYKPKGITLLYRFDYMSCCVRNDSGIRSTVGRHFFDLL